MGSLLGLCLVGPLVAAVRARSLGALLPGALRGARLGAAVGLLAGPGVTEMALRGQEDEAVYSRALRIRYNRGQMRADRMFYSGGLGGLALGGILGPGAYTGAVLGGLGARVGGSLLGKALGGQEG